MSAGTTTFDNTDAWRPAVNPWIIAITVTLATFMEVLDTSIANVALPHIAGSLSAGQDESTWVLTSYLVSNAIVLPLSGWLSSIIGRKNFYMSCVALFTVSSFLCGLAPNLATLIVCRILQGVGGSRVSRRFWPIPFLRLSVAWRLRCTEWPWSLLPRLGRRWAAGLRTTSPGAGFSSSIFPSVLFP